MRLTTPKQRDRLVLLIIDVLVVMGASQVAFGTPLFPTGDKGFWFIAALLGLLIGSRIITPYFTRPADAFCYAVPALAALGLVAQEGHWTTGVWIAFFLTVAFVALIVVLAAFTMLTKDTESDRTKRLSDASKLIAETLGKPKVIYSTIIAFALYAFHADSQLELASVASAWLLTGVFNVSEGVWNLVRRLRNIFGPTNSLRAEAEIAAFQTPGVVLLRQSTATGHLPTLAAVALRDPLGEPRLALTLDYVGRDAGVLLRAVEASDAILDAEVVKLVRTLPPNSASRLPASLETAKFSALFERKSQLIGLVAPDTTNEALHFEVVVEEGVHEGSLVEVRIGQQPVLFQVVAGATKEEVIQQKNTHGYVRARAQKIGVWQEGTGTLEPADWLPMPNAPVYLRESEAPASDPDAIGYFPGTRYPAKIKSVHDLVTHNTAILGILGVGKSMLAIEIVERLIAAGVKVVCLDLTNQYAEELAAYYDEPYESDCLQKLAQADQTDRDTPKVNPERGGSFPTLRQAIYDDLKIFLDEANPRKLKIYNPALFSGTKQLRDLNKFMFDGQWTNTAALWDVTPVDVTRVVSEAVLALVQDRMSDKARVCLVLEEAHSLVPEFGSVATPTDSNAVNATARAILQGRKFGLGCLLITQRTANVTKTILNQCNTVFAMRTFDETGKSFLANYLGRAHADALSALPERHAVLFGKASSCANPILIQLNDRNAFLERFREVHPPPPLAEAAAKEEPPPATPLDGSNLEQYDLEVDLSGNEEEPPF